MTDKGFIVIDKRGIGPLFTLKEVMRMSPAVSKAQQKFMGGIVGGTIKAPKGLTKKIAKEFAETPRKGLPEKKGK